MGYRLSGCCLPLGAVDPSVLQKRLDDVNRRIQALVPRLKKNFEDAALFERSVSWAYPGKKEYAKKLQELAAKVSETDFTIPPPSYFKYEASSQTIKGETFVTDGDGWKEVSKWPIMGEWLALEREKKELSEKVGSEVKSATTTKDKLKKYGIPAVSVAAVVTGLWLMFRKKPGLGGV